MNGLTKLGTVLTVVFSVSILALIVELIYVLWRKRVFRRRTDPELGSDPFYMTPSKEQLLYFFCWKNPSRVEPAGISTLPEPPGAEAVDDELAKWQQGMYGPSRFLFTIKEEEREGTETETENDQATGTKTVRAEAESLSEVEMGVIIQAVEEEATPFSTPCGSPPYYTPSPSPTRDEYSPGNCENDVSYVILQVSGDNK
ncbi:hypothetical protein ACOSP7_028818 [Xanthoceras sorbifolium]|uniref:Uncharacterized protein n=1 Tax=Xanthoceras sorbifolium TaxID=99658 RepID=A0ABQ8HCE4_9ROSI|nr:hypothetical protein JRO89_XS12G0121800 [Xanthoceras sorbifolium]